MRTILNLFFFLILFPFIGEAQTNDNIIWASFKVQKNISPKTSVTIAPIFRFNRDVTSYDNLSIDISAKRKFGKEWSAQLLARTWFIPNNAIRQFIWLDVSIDKPLGKIAVGSRLRLHYAIDVNGNNDSDFIRWLTGISFPKIGKITPTFAVEPWIHINNGFVLERFRLEPGLKYKISDRMTLSAIYRREDSIHIEPTRNFNMYLINLSLVLP